MRFGILVAVATYVTAVRNVTPLVRDRCVPTLQRSLVPPNTTDDRDSSSLSDVGTYLRDYTASRRKAK